MLAVFRPVTIAILLRVALHVMAILSVCLSVTLVICFKTAKYAMKPSSSSLSCGS